MLWVLVLFILLDDEQASVHCYPTQNLSLDGENPGEPLFLSPYIKGGNITEGRRLARVLFTESLLIKSYAGFFTVDKSHDSNQFFWYFPAIEPHGEDAPVMVWLQGGPGTTSLDGLFEENGPLQIIENKFTKIKYHWALNHHMIYIDNPVGTGFSFTNDSKGYCTNETQVGEQLYSTLIQFFQLFPELQSNKFFVSGESYAGKYAPALSYTIHQKNPTAQIKINMKGMVIGNGFSDPVNQLGYSNYLYQIGLIDWNQAKIFEEYEGKVKYLIKQEQWNEAFDTYDKLFFGNSLNGLSIFKNITGFDFYHNYLQANVSKQIKDFMPMVQKNAVRKAIHVGDLPFNNGTEVKNHLKQDIMKSVAPWISELLDNYNVLIYNGQLDVIVAYPLTLNYLRTLNFTGAEEYKTAKRNIWKVDDEVAGYVKQAGKLTEILVRNAGHMVPRDQPKWAFDMISRFTNEKSFY